MTLSLSRQAREQQADYQTRLASMSSRKRYRPSSPPTPAVPLTDGALAIISRQVQVLQRVAEKGRGAEEAGKEQLRTQQKVRMSLMQVPPLLLLQLCLV